MDSQDTAVFLREREKRLGNRIIYRTYSTWYARIGHEKREYGVFLYTDGRTVIFEDFDRQPQLLGIPLRRKEQEKYEKLEVSFPVSMIMSIDRARKRDAEVSFSSCRDTAKSAGALAKAFCKLVTKVTLTDGTVMFFEMMDHRDFLKRMTEYKKEAADERIQGI